METEAHEQWRRIVVRQEAQGPRDHFALLGLERLERVVLRAEHHQRNEERVDELAVLTSRSGMRINIFASRCSHQQNRGAGHSAQLLAHGVIGRNAVGCSRAKRVAQVWPIGLHLLE